jgi:hypothetical protein
MTITKKTALENMIKFANQHKRTYVRVADRNPKDDDIDGTDFVLQYNVSVYSKTWSKITVRLFANGKYHNLKTARKLLEEK